MLFGYKIQEVFKTKRLSFPGDICAQSLNRSNSMLFSIPSNIQVIFGRFSRNSSFQGLFNSS